MVRPKDYVYLSHKNNLLFKLDKNSNSNAINEYKQHCKQRNKLIKLPKLDYHKKNIYREQNQSKISLENILNELINHKRKKWQTYSK